MDALFIYTLFDDKTNRPRCVGIKDGDRIIIRDLFRPGAGKRLNTIFSSIKLVRELILVADSSGRKIVTSNFKRYLAAFDLPLRTEAYNVYDLHLPHVSPRQSRADDIKIITKILDKMSKQRPKDYQRIIANASVVYQDLEQRGITINYVPKYPKWSTNTFSGRSKTTGCNIQGWSEHDRIMPPGAVDSDVLIHFDWICADIRVASLLSSDAALQAAFDESDPYNAMMGVLNNEMDALTRDECKLYLLKSINSMDFSSLVLTEVYPDLGNWIRDCRNAAQEPGGYLETILGRRFRAASARNEFAVLNGVMQGSVVHAMQRVIREIWEDMPHRLVAEIHDSLVVASDRSNISSVINKVVSVMLYPLKGLVRSNPAFPVKVSVGSKWRAWKPFATYRSTGVEYVKEKQDQPTAEDQKETHSQAASKRKTSC